MTKIHCTRFPVTSLETGKLPTCYGLVTGKLVKVWLYYFMLWAVHWQTESRNDPCWQQRAGETSVGGNCPRKDVRGEYVQGNVWRPFKCHNLKNLNVQLYSKLIQFRNDTKLHVVFLPFSNKKQFTKLSGSWVFPYHTTLMIRQLSEGFYQNKMDLG